MLDLQLIKITSDFDAPLSTKFQTLLGKIVFCINGIMIESRGSNKKVKNFGMLMVEESTSVTS